MKRSLRAAAVVAVLVPLAALAGLTSSADAAGKVKVRFVNTPAVASNKTDMQLRFARNVKYGIKSQQCRIDRSRWTDCFKRFVIKDLADGKHTAYVRLVMKDGQKASDKRSWLVDTVTPSAPQVIGGDALWANLASRSITHAESADPAPSSGVQYQRRISADGGATWKPTGAGEDIVVTREGDTRVQYRALDVAGNASEWVETPVKLDRTAPGLPTTNGGSSLWRSLATVDVVDQKDANDPLSGVPTEGYELQTRIPGGDTWSDPQTDISGAVTVTDEGVTEVRFRATDLAGNAGDWTTPEVVSLDRTAPTAPSITGGGTWTNSDVTITNNADATDTLSGIGSDGYQYQTSADNGATWIDAQADTANVVTVSDEGATLVRVRATDMAGNPSPWTEGTPDGAGSALIDKTAPAVPVIGVDSAWTNLAGVDAMASTSGDTLGAPLSSGFDHFMITTSTDGAPGLTVNNAAGILTVGGEGVTDVVAAACDVAGNCSDYSQIAPDAQVKIDRTAPQVPSVTGSNGWTNADRFEASAASADTLGAAGASGVDHYTVQTSVDGGITYGLPSQSDTVAITDEGVSDVIAAACDIAGNCSDFSTIDPQAQVKIDRTAPAVPAVVGSNGWTNAASTEATAASSDTLGAAQSSGLDHYLIEKAGAEPGLLTTTDGTVAVSTEGITDVSAAACDLAGNCSDYSAIAPDAKVKIDRVAPAVPSVTGSNGWTNIGSATAASDDTLGVANSSGMAHYLIQKTGAESGQVTDADGTVAVSTEGITDVSAAACDAAGNCSDYSLPAPESRVQIDRTAPTVPGFSGGGSTWSKTPVGITNLANATDATSQIDPNGYEFQTSSNNGSTWGSAQLDATHVVSVATDGTTLVRFRARDNAGNAGAWTTPVANGAGTARIDTTAPKVPIVTGPAGWNGTGWTNAASATATAASAGDTLGASPSSGLAHYMVRTSTNGGTTWGAPTQSSGASLPVTTEGVVEVSAAACDQAGNCSAYSPVNATAEVRIDRTPPTVATSVTGGTQTGPCADSDYKGGNWFVAQGVTDTLSYLWDVRARASNETGAIYSISASLSFMDAPIFSSTITGRVHVQFQATDAAGNVGQWSDPNAYGAVICIR